jgi:hypothetical protein
VIRDNRDAIRREAPPRRFGWLSHLRLPIHPTSWKGSSRKLDFRFTEFLKGSLAQQDPPAPHSRRSAAYQTTLLPLQRVLPR